jgi:hypothetical protein
MKDGDGNREIVSETIKYTTGDALSIKVLGNGGFVVWIQKK